MSRLTIAILLFGLTALVGPLVRWMTWPPSAFEQSTSTVLSIFVSDLVFLLWPTQSLAVIEVNTGPFLAAVVAVGTNILLLIVIGVLAGALAKWHIGLLALYLVVVVLVVLLALWGAGFNVVYLNVLALAVALLLYAVPFCLIACLAR